MKDKSDWTKEFDKRIGMALCYLGSGGKEHLDKIKSFISQLLKEQREELNEG